MIRSTADSPFVGLQRFPEGGGTRQISTSGGSQPRWSRDGKELFYVRGDTLMVVSVTTSPSFSAGAVTELFSDPNLAWRWWIPT